MAKYYLFLLIASIWLFTVLCVSAANLDVKKDQAATDADFFNGNVETAFQHLARMDESSNIFLKFFRDTAKKGIASLEKDKQFIKDAVTKGTEMEKKIQSISDTLKNSNVTLPAELQSELEEIEKNAAAELKKLKGVEDVKDIEEMHKRYNAKYTEFSDKIKALSNLVLDQIKKDKEKEGKSNTNIITGRVQNTHALVSKLQSTQESDSFDDKAKKLLIEFITTSVPVAFTMKQDAEAISKKMDVASSALSNIRDDLIKVEQMEYHLLGAHKDLFKTDFASLTRSSMAQFAFAVMFGMLF